jgi:hypothetical protein
MALEFEVRASWDASTFHQTRAIARKKRRKVGEFCTTARTLRPRILASCAHRAAQNSRLLLWWIGTPFLRAILTQSVTSTCAGTPRTPRCKSQKSSSDRGYRPIKCARTPCKSHAVPHSGPTRARAKMNRRKNTMGTRSVAPRPNLLNSRAGLFAGQRAKWTVPTMI